jgi:hypothetical protein
MPLKFVKDPILSRKISSGLCICQFCNNKSAKNRKICHKHISDKFKEDNPVKYVFKVTKNNAKRRGISFNITFEEFSAWCEEYDYIKLKGIYKNSMTIDRKRNDVGYTYENMQPMTNSNNVRKMWVDIKIKNGKYLSQKELQELYETIPTYHKTVPLTEEDDSVPF